MGMSILNNKLQLLQLIVFLVVLLHFDVNLLALIESSNCNASCANLNHSSIPTLYPFASRSSASCALSSSFLLSGCSSQQAYWDAFTSTIGRPPAVMGIARVNYSTYIDVTWDSDLISQPHTYLHACSTPPVALNNLTHTIPPYIDLSPFDPSSLNVQFSSNINVYLLFNCAHSSPDDLNRLQQSTNTYDQTLEANTALCKSYRSQCTGLFNNYTGPCVQLSFVEGYESSPLSLQTTMERLVCTHFQFFVTKTGATDVAVTEWGKAILQLQWTDPYCWSCLGTGGSCVLDSTNHTFKQCTNCTYGGKIVDGFCAYSECHLAGRFSICHTRIKIAVSILVVIVGSLLLLFALYYRRRIKRRRSMKSVEKLTKLFPRKSAWPRQEHLSSGSNESDLNELDLNGLSERPMEYSYSSIAAATNSFSSKVGEGGFGVVFKGALNADQAAGGTQEIAVKVLEVRSKYSRKQFLNEVAIIGRIHHVNVVRLLGFCVQQEEHEMLVYEYVVKGSLDTWLFSTTGGDHHVEKKQLEWGQRYGIALGVARGLSYLHEECRHRIVHCDIKPHNILLDASMCPKIADFGLARLMSRDESRVVTLAKGTPGYMAPEFWVGGDIHLSTKADVYSYGMVLLELVSGRPNFAGGCRRFPAVAFEAAVRGDFESIVDVRLQAVTASTEEERLLMWQQVRIAIFVAFWCIQEHPASRPAMSEVVQYLEGIAAISEQPPLPAIAFESTCATSPLLPIGLYTSSQLQCHTPISGR